MERKKIKVLIDYLYEFHETLTKMEVQKNFKTFKRMWSQNNNLLWQGIRTNKRFY